MKILKNILFIYLLLYFVISHIAEVQKGETRIHDYQFDIDARNDTTVLNIYDADRFVGTASPATIEEFLIGDNQ